VRRLPENLVVFSPDQVDARTVRRGEEPLAHLYGISYPRRDVTENLALRFSRQDAPGLHIGVLHCNVGYQPEHSAYSPCTVADLAAAGMDYWALGHIHQYQRLAEGRPWIVYSGSLQAVKSNEQGPKGAVVVEALGDTVTAVEFAPLGRVRFARAEVDIAGEPDLPSLQKAILAQSVSDGSDLLLTVILTGRGPLHHDLRRQGTIEDLTRDLREELGIASPFVWIDRIVDHTHAELDRKTIVRRGDFSAELMRMSGLLQADPEMLEQVLTDLWRPSGRFDEEDRLAILGEAEERALDLLEGELQR